MAVSVTELLKSQNTDNKKSFQLNAVNAPAPYAQAQMLEGKNPTELSDATTTAITDGFDQSVSSVNDSLKDQTNVLKQQGQKLDSISGLLKDQYEYQRKKDLHVDPTIQRRNGGAAGQFAPPEAMEKVPAAGGGLLGMLAGLGGGLGLGSIFGKKGTAAPVPGKAGAKPGKVPGKLGGAAGVAGKAGEAGAKPGFLSKLKGFGGSGKGKLLMSALALGGGLIGFDYITQALGEKQAALHGRDVPDGHEGYDMSSVGAIGTALAGATGVASLLSLFEKDTDVEKASADTKGKMGQSAADVAKSSKETQTNIKSSESKFSKLISEQTSKLKDTVSNVTSKITERFSALTGNNTTTSVETSKVSDVVKESKVETVKPGEVKSTTAARDVVKAGEKAVPKGAIGKVASGAGKVLSGAGKLAGKALPGLGVAMEAYDLYGTLSDDQVSGGDKAKAVAKSAGGLAGAAGGAALGAAAGSIVPVIGTAVGGILGGIAGYFGGSEVTDLVTTKLSDTVQELGIGDAIGRAVAVPMAAFSEDARNALSQDISENVMPKIDEYKKSVMNFFGFGEEEEEVDKQAKILNKEATAATVASAASLAAATAPARAASISPTVKPTTTVAATTKPTTVVAPKPAGAAKTAASATPVVAGTAAGAFAAFEAKRGTTVDSEDDDVFAQKKVAAPKSTVSPERITPERDAFAQPASAITPSTATVNNTGGARVSNVSATTNATDKQYSSTANPMTTNIKNNAVDARVSAAPAVTNVYNNDNRVTNNSTVQNYTQTPAPERAVRGQYEQVSKVMMVEGEKKKEPKIEQTPPKSNTGAGSSYKPKLEEIPTVVTDFGLMFINTGFL